MKFIPATIFLIISTIILTDCNAYLSDAALKKTVSMLKNVCSNKYPVDEEIFNNVKAGIFTDDNNNLKCYFACVMKTMQMVSPKGVIEKKSFKDKMTMLASPSMLEILLPTIEECAGKDTGELCENSYNFIKCVHGVNPRALEFLPL